MSRPACDNVVTISGADGPRDHRTKPFACWSVVRSTACGYRGGGASIHDPITHALRSRDHRFLLLPCRWIRGAAAHGDAVALAASNGLTLSQRLRAGARIGYFSCPSLTHVPA